MNVRSPASPPSVAPGAANMGPDEAVFWNLNDGLTICSAPAICLPGISVIAAGLDQATLASSATAEPPAKALPVPLPLWVPIAKPAPKALDTIPPRAAPTASAIKFLDVRFMCAPPNWYLRKDGDTESPAILLRTDVFTTLHCLAPAIVAPIQHAGADRCPPRRRSAAPQSP